MKLSRRQVLKAGGGVLGQSLLMAQMPPVAKIVDIMLRQQMRSAKAATTAGIGTTYINLSLPAAPPRWCFDHFIQTRSSGETMSPNPMVATQYVASGGNYQSTAYKTMNYNGVQVPTIWGTQVQSASGGKRPMSDLLKNMIVFRGYGTGTDGHPTNFVRQTNPTPGAGSVSGWMADNSATLFKAVQFPSLGSYNSYSSLLGTGLTSFGFGGAANYAAQLMNPFGSRSESTALDAVRARYADIIATAKTALATQVSSDHADFAPVNTDQTQAISKIKQGIADVDSAWAPLYNKYLAIANATYQDRTQAGFNDMPIITGNDDGASGESYWSYFTGTTYMPQGGVDVRDFAKSIDLSEVAATFALAEFVVTRGLTSAHEMSINQPGGLVMPIVRTVGGPTTAPQMMGFPLIFDQHATGIGTGLYLNTSLYRSLSACILELVDQLKTSSMWGSTVIHVTSDFGRSPKPTAGGQDHGFDSMIASAFTGMQNSGAPIVVGNILSSGSNGQMSYYPGSWGYKAATNVSGTSAMLTPAHVASSLAQLLQLPKNPWGNVSTPLLTYSNGVVTAQAEGKWVTS